jgi:hypothetical protein
LICRRQPDSRENRKVVSDMSRVRWAVWPGVDVMITICCDFWQFSAKKLAFSKTIVMIKILHNLAIFWVKNANFFRWIFRRKYSKDHNIGPRWREVSPSWKHHFQNNRSLSYIHAFRRLSATSRYKN